MKKTDLLSYILTIAFLVFALVSYLVNFNPGILLMNNFWGYVKFILLLMPGVFLLIGLFNIWVKKETVMKYMGHESGLKGYFLAIILSFTVIGGLFAALPVSKQLHDKGARLSTILVYLGAASVCRVPMTLWEASMLGVQFTVIRYLISIPLIILSSIFIEKVFGHSMLIKQSDKIVR